MTRSLRRLLAAFAASLAVAFPAAATTYSTDYSDLWYLPAEDGWGVNVIQQHDIIFATFFVYGTDGTPRWFVAPATLSLPAQPNSFSGPLYSTTGTYFGAPWVGKDQAQVGNVSFFFSTPSSGAVSYTVNGVQVTKSIVRQTWRGNFLTGNYIGGTSANGTNCRSGVANGPILIHGELTIGHSNFFSPTFRVDFINAAAQRGTCTYTGSYSQEGRLGSVTGGTFSCVIQGVTNPPVGTFTLTQIEASIHGLNARFRGSDQFCDYDGYFGGIRDVL